MSAAHALAVALISAEVVALDAEGGVWLAEELASLERDGWTFVPPPPDGDGTHPTPHVALFALERLAGLREVLRNAETALAKTHPAEATALMLLLNGLDDLERGEVTPDGG